MRSMRWQMMAANLAGLPVLAGFMAVMLRAPWADVTFGWAVSLGVAMALPAVRQSDPWCRLMGLLALAVMLNLVAVCLLFARFK